MRIGPIVEGAESIAWQQQLDERNEPFATMRGHELRESSDYR
jgi:hypothetical protein